MASSPRKLKRLGYENLQNCVNHRETYQENEKKLKLETNEYEIKSLPLIKQHEDDIKELQTSLNIQQLIIRIVKNLLQGSCTVCRHNDKDLWELISAMIPKNGNGYITFDKETDEYLLLSDSLGKYGITLINISQINSVIKGTGPTVSSFIVTFQPQNEEEKYNFIHFRYEKAVKELEELRQQTIEISVKTDANRNNSKETSSSEDKNDIATNKMQKKMQKQTYS